MNWDQIEGNWKDLKGKLRSRWGKFTDDDVENIAGKRKSILGRLQHHYGVKKEEAERELDAVIKKAGEKNH